MSDNSIQISDIIKAFNLNPCLGSTVKGICLREDLKEALKCLNLEINLQENLPKEEGRKEEQDSINPHHYKAAAGFQVIDVIEGYELNFPLGNAIKYVCRHSNKNGLEDLKKARWYLNREIENQEKGLATKGP